MAEITTRMNAAVTLRGRPETRLTIENSSVQPVGDADAAVGIITLATPDGLAVTAASAISTMAHLVMAQEFLTLAWN